MFVFSTIRCRSVAYPETLATPPAQLLSHLSAATTTTVCRPIGVLRQGTVLGRAVGEVSASRAVRVRRVPCLHTTGAASVNEGRGRLRFVVTKSRRRNASRRSNWQICSRDPCVVWQWRR